MLRNTWLTSWKSRWYANRRRVYCGNRTDQMQVMAKRMAVQRAELLEDRALPATITVTSLADNETVDGQVTLREALQAANTDTAIDGSTSGNGADTIVFAEGLSGTITLNGTELVISSDVTITGPGSGSLSIDAHDDSRIFNVSGVEFGVFASISGLTLTNGSSTSGGAIINTTTLTVSDCVISNSNSQFEGGAIYTTHALTVHQSSLTGNSSSLGGAICNASGILTVSNSTISGNTAGNGGGGIYSQGSVTVLQSTISGNTSSYSSGGLANFGTAYIRESTVSGNSALNGNAGGIGNGYGLLIVFNSTVSGNSASNNGGGIGNASGATLSVIQSTISGNTAGESGGGIGNEGTASIHQSTITGNSAALADNGGGVGFTGATTLINTIVAGNTADGTPDDLAGEQNVESDSKHNLIGDPNSAGGMTHGANNNIVGADNGAGGRTLLATSSVLVTTLANAGGPTLTHALVTGSPAINAGGNFSVHDDIFDQDGDNDFEEDLPFDQRGEGFARRVGDGATPPVDIGAIEFSTPPNFVSVTVSPESVLEDGAVNLVYTFTRTETTGSLTVNFSVSGDATFETDYMQSGAATFTETSGTVTFADGQATKTITVNPTGDTTRENDELVILTVAAGTGYIASDVAAAGEIANDDFIVVDTLTDVDNDNFDPGNLSLREAIRIANEDPGFDTITFAASLFGSAKTITLSNLGDLDITTSMEIVGPGANLLTISGNNASRIFHISDDDEGTLNEVTISGLKLTNGRAILDEESEDATDLDGLGGAILNFESLSISNSTISGNIASEHGGGIFSEDFSHLSVHQSTISGNTARSGNTVYGFYGAGGGIKFGAGSTGAVTSSTISGNLSVNGGGLFIDAEAIVTVSQSTISGNTAFYGGGVFNYGGVYGGELSLAVTIHQSTISGNTTTSISSDYGTYGGDGAGIANEGFMAVAESTIKDNNAAGSGGGIGNGLSGSLTVVNSTFSNNVAGGSGGGIGNLGALIVIQSTISGNRATGPGSGIGNSGLASIEQSTIVKNTTTNSQGGGGLAFSYSTTLINTIVAGNTFNSTPRDLFSAGEELESESRHNLIGDPNTAGGLVHGDMGNILGNNGTSVLALASILNTTLANNGGSTLTHNLVSGSKAIDAGGNFSVPSDVADIDGDLDTDEEIPFDQRGNGFVRRFGTGDPVPVDIGAIEFAPPPVFVTVAVSPASVAENGPTNLVYTFTRTGTTGTLTVNFLVDGTATFNTDYVATGAATFDAIGGTVTFAAGSATKTITVDPTPDPTVEGNETVEIIVASGTGYTVGTNHHATGTINNDDTTFSIAALDAEKAEGNTGSTPFTFTVTRTGVTTGSASVKFAVTGSGDNPANAADFGTTSPGTSFPSGTVSFAANETSKTVTINVKGDTNTEGDEGFTVTLSNPPTGATIETATATGTILADDTALNIAAASASNAEGDTGTTEFTFTVTRVGPSTGTASANFAVTGTAVNGANADDFGGTFPNGTVEFADGETTQTITVLVTGDTSMEVNEVFTVALSGATIPLGTASANGTILNDDASLSIAATSANKAEGNSGSTPFTFTVTRNGSTIGTASVEFSVAGSGANAADADDFSNLPELTGLVEFADGEATQVITVNVAGDNDPEANEGFTVTLSDPLDAELGPAEASGTIQNDDAALAIAATSASKAEGNTGNTAFTFTVTRSGTTTGASSVNFAVTGSGDNPADAADFANNTLPSGTLNFANGQSSQVITVNVAGNLIEEANEGFTVTLSDAVGAGIVTGSANGTIVNDDATVSIAATNAERLEGNTGTTPFTFTVTRTGSTAAASSVKFAVTGSGASPATTSGAANDFSGAITGTVSFAANETTKIVTINVKGDTSIESDEEFTVTLNTPKGASIGQATAIGTILADDAGLSIAATNAVQSEGNDGDTPLTFTVTRIGPATGAASANFAVTGTGATGANAADFGGTLPSGVVEFEDGETSQLITLNVSGDTLVEPNEAFTVTLSNPVGALLGTKTVSGMINNDDTNLSIVATSATKPEGNSGVIPFTFTVTRTGFTTGPAHADLVIVGSGDHPTDVDDFSGTLPTSVDFAAGETLKVITVNVAGDTTVEPDETFTVTLANLTGATVGTASATGSIQSEDSELQIVAMNASRAEGDKGNTPFTFQVNRIGGTLLASSTKFTVTGSGDNPAVAADFAATTGTVNLAKGVASALFTVNVKGDLVTEPDEGFTVTLSEPKNTTLGAANTAQGTILNDENTLTIAADSADKAEGDTGNTPGTPFTFTITRTGALASDVSVKFTVAGLAGAAGSGITAAAAADFVATTGTVNIPAGQATGTLTVNVLGDTLVEAAEGFKVTLSAPTGAVLGAAANIVANGVIRNDDASVSIAATSAVKAEGTGDTPTPFTFTVTRTGDVTAASSVNFAVTGAATNGADAFDFGGEFPTGTIEFAENETTQAVTINVTADNFGEANEGFVVNLLNPDNCIIGTASANGTINNDDTSASFAIKPVNATSAVKAEGSSTSNPLANTKFTFTVERTGAAVAGSVQFAVTGSGDNPADADDFANDVLPTGTLNFTAAQKTQTVTINVRADKLVEANEGFTVTLANPTGVTNIASPTATGTINNDDTSFSIAAVDAENEEGNSGLTAFTFLVTRTGLTTGTGSVKFVVSGVGEDPTTSVDFGTHVPANTVNFAANETQKTITINVKGDTTVEEDEDFVVTLNTPSGGASLANPTANGTIINDDLLAELP